MSLIISMIYTVTAYSQIKGIVIEDSTNEPLFSAYVQLLKTPYGTLTDIDGKFELSPPIGKYDISVSFLGLKSTIIKDVIISSDTIELNLIIRLKNDTENLNEITVTAESIRNTESSIISIRSKSTNIMDGISSEQLSRVGDGNVATAVKRITGVSVQGGKYVYVRGLGDRYTKTTLHNMDIPGLDPDRNALQMDIFPTNIIDNIIVRKTFSADMPADFTGGIVNIETKEFPEKTNLIVSTDIGFTPGMHFNNEYRTQKGGKLDFLGFDDGTRSEPLNMSSSNPTPNGNIPDPTLNPSVNVGENTKKFNTELGSSTGTSPMNFGMGVSNGGNRKLDDKTFGWFGSLSYKNKTLFYENWEQNYYRKAENKNILDLQTERIQSGPLGINTVLLSGMVGGAIKTVRSKYKINFMHLQNGESKSGFMEQRDFISTNNEQIRHNLEYSERSITNALIGGEHLFLNTDWCLRWNISPTYSSIADKDVRMTSYLIDRDTLGVITNYTIDPSEGSWPIRLWRNLSEYDIANRVDVEYNHTLLKHSAKLDIGVSYTYKIRNYTILDYTLRGKGGQSIEGSFVGNGDELLSEETIWSSSNPNQLGSSFIYGQYQENNTYSATQSIISFYVSEELHLTKKLKIVIGVRLENYNQFYTGQNQIANTSPNSPAARIFDNARLLNTTQLFPSLNLIYHLNNISNIRGSYSMTTARPSFKEISTAEIVDVLSGMTFIGNIDLVQTDIQNFDIRYEAFYNRNQMFSVSGFYKSFTNPIELISYEQDNTSFQPRNVGDARVLGMEFEGSLNLMSLFFLSANLSIIDARVRYDNSSGGDYDGKENGLRDGETISLYRDMQCQSPYIINMGIGYRGNKNNYEMGLFYNVQGPKLISVGINLTPDVYTVPFHSLNFNFQKQFGKDKKYRFSFSIDNILDDIIETETKSFGTTPHIFNRLTPRRTFGLAFSYEMKN